MFGLCTCPVFYFFFSSSSSYSYLFFFFSFSFLVKGYMDIICQHFYNKSTRKRHQEHNKILQRKFVVVQHKKSNISENVIGFPCWLFFSSLFLLSTFYFLCHYAKKKNRKFGHCFTVEKCQNTLSFLCLTLNWNSLVRVYVFLFVFTDLFTFHMFWVAFTLTTILDELSIHFNSLKMIIILSLMHIHTSTHICFCNCQLHHI